MDLTDIMLSERNQTQILPDSIFVKFKNEQNQMMVTEVKKHKLLLGELWTKKETSVVLESSTSCLGSGYTDISTYKNSMSCTAKTEMKSVF